jgi:FKBP-type peptidyl-prolyl cis-trans isomerase
MLRPNRVAASSSVKEIPLTTDGELTKKIIKEGGEDAVPHGAMIAVHYVGRLQDGTIFDESYKRNQPFVFAVGKGNVIKGWDIGVQSMKVGEIAVLKCGPSYAYGSRGAGGVIPPNATLFFEVEVLEIKEDSEKYQNLLTMGVFFMFITVVLYLVFNRVYPLVPNTPGSDR